MAPSSAFETSIKGMILGTTTWKQAMAGIFQAVLGQFINLTVKMGQEWLIAEIKKTSASQAGTEARVAIEHVLSLMHISFLVLCPRLLFWHLLPQRSAFGFQFIAPATVGLFSSYFFTFYTLESLLH